MKFKIINSDQGHNYTHYVDAPDRQTAMDRFKAGHYGSILDCEEVKEKVTEDKKAPVDDSNKSEFEKHQAEVMKIILGHRGVQSRKVHWEECSWAIAAYLKKHASQERNRAIDQCIDIIINDHKATAGKILVEFGKLKKDS